MFPLVVKIKPKYKESYVVAFADKLVWGYEKFVRYCNNIQAPASVKKLSEK